MKILLANKFYYPRGGDCICTINLEALLKAKGHEVAIFSMQHPQNLPSEYSKYFPREVEFSLSNKKQILEAMIRPFGNKEVKKKFNRLLDDFKPDVVHLQNIHTQLSPIIAQIAHKRGIKVVWTLHDYKLLCPRSDCRRDNKPCESCFQNKKNVLKYNCMKNSKAASILAYLEALKWNKSKLEKYTDTFICPSQFINDKMKQGGFKENKLKTLCNFIDADKIKINNEQWNKEDYYCYIGRLSEEKGIETLLKAASQLPYLLKIAGTGPLFDELKEKYASDKIEFLGHQTWDKVKEIISKSQFTVIPSEWYENNPLSVIEALCLGTPVLGANIGGIPELIDNKLNGDIFESKNTEELENKIISMHTSNNFNYKEIAVMAQKKYSSENYYQQLLKIYQI